MSRAVRDIGPLTAGRPACDDGRVKKAIAIVGLCVAVIVVASVLDLRVPAAHRALTQTDPAWTSGIPGLGLAVPGALLLRRAPRNPIGWLLVLAGLHWCVDGAAASYLAYATMTQPARPGASAA